MSKKMLTILAAVLLVGITVPAFAAVQNVKVGGDITIRGIYRKNFDFTKDTIAKDTSGWLMTTTRVYVSSELTDNVAAVIRLINERDWADNRGATGTNDQIDLDLAYIKLSDMFAPGFSATLGRQEILFGEGMVVGNSSPYASAENLAALDYNSRKSFDALRLDYEVAAIPLTLTGFAAKIMENYATVVGATTTTSTTTTFVPGTGPTTTTTTTTTGGDSGLDQDLYGINANYQVPTAEAEVEGYFVNLRNASASKNSANYLSVPTFGIRTAHNIAAIPGLSWKGELAGQWGKNNVVVAGSNEDNKGIAGYAGADYAFQDVAWEPKVGLSYAYYSGDDNATDSSNEAWISLYPDGLADKIGAITYGSGATQDSNLQIIKLIGSIQPTEKLGISLAWFNDNRVKTAAGVKKELGNEIDLSLNYAYSEDVAMGLLFGYFVKGNNIKDTVETASGAGSATDAMEIVGTVAVSF